MNGMHQQRTARVYRALRVGWKLARASRGAARVAAATNPAALAVDAVLAVADAVGCYLELLAEQERTKQLQARITVQRAQLEVLGGELQAALARAEQQRAESRTVIAAQARVLGPTQQLLTILGDALAEVERAEIPDLRRYRQLVRQYEQVLTEYGHVLEGTLRHERGERAAPANAS